MSKGEQEARIALLQEYASNARNWYSVLLGLAIVFFAAVQAGLQLQIYNVCFDGFFKMTLWRLSLAVIASQVLYAMVRAADNTNLARSVVGVNMPVPFDANKLEILRDEVERKGKLLLWLWRTWRGWIVWTGAVVFVLCWQAPSLEALFSCA